MDYLTTFPGKYGVHRVVAVDSPGGDLHNIITQSAVVDVLHNNLEVFPEVMNKTLEELGVVQKQLSHGVITVKLTDTFWTAFSVMSKTVCLIEFLFVFCKFVWVCYKFTNSLHIYSYSYFCIYCVCIYFSSLWLCHSSPQPSPWSQRRVACPAWSLSRTCATASKAMSSSPNSTSKLARTPTSCMFLYCNY